MPIEPYLRGSTWWAKGRVEYLGTAISEYYRCSTGAFDEAGALRWCQAEEERRIRRHLVGEENALTFAEAVMIYQADEKTAGYLIPVTTRLGKDDIRTSTEEWTLAAPSHSLRSTGEGPDKP